MASVIEIFQTDEDIVEFSDESPDMDIFINLDLISIAQ